MLHSAETKTTVNYKKVLSPATWIIEKLKILMLETFFYKKMVCDDQDISSILLDQLAQITVFNTFRSLCICKIEFLGPIYEVKYIMFSCACRHRMSRISANEEVLHQWFFTCTKVPEDIEDF